MLNTSLSSVAQYAACLLVHNPDQDANAADDRLAAERMEAYVGDLPRPTPDVRRRLRRRRKRRRSDAGAVTARRTSDSATREPPPPPPPLAKRLLPREQEAVLLPRRRPTLPPLRHGRAAGSPWRRHPGAANSPPRISGALGTSIAR